MELNNIDFSEVFSKNYTEYAKYTINSRAIPNLEDGCKIIHRRILWSMYVNKNTWDKKRVKANTAVGLTMGYSPHGNTSIYGAMVRFANDSVNLNLIDGKGAFSSKTSRDVDAGADRYVEVRLAPIVKEYLKDIDKNIVEMKNNYDNTKLEPSLLPTTFPTILANPNLGIATGIACNICGFEISDLVDSTLNIIDGKEPNFMIPTFPTYGELIYDEKALKSIQETGKGKLILRATYHYEDNKIVITSIPYTTTREAIIEKIIDLVKDGKIKDIVDINDNTGRCGLKITINVKKNCDKDKLMAVLFNKTTLQDTFSCNFNVLDNGVPKTLGTNEIIKKWLIFRRKCLRRKIENDITTKGEKLNILLGLKEVLLDIDKAIEIIRKHSNPEEELMNIFRLNTEQAEYILSMKLRNINKDYIIKQIKDIDNLKQEVDFLRNNIDNIDYINNIIKDDLIRVKKNYSYERQTKIIYNDNFSNINSKQDLIEQYNWRIYYTNHYIKKYRKQSDNHKYKDTDTILGDITTTNKSTLLLFTNKANRYKIPVYELSTYTPSQLGDYVYNITTMDKDEQIIKVVSIPKDYKKDSYIVCVYDNGKVAKINIESYLSNNKKLQNCYNTDSKLIGIDYITKDVDIFLLSEEGKALTINTERINPKGSRTTQGTTGIKLNEGYKCIASIIGVTKDYNFKLITEKGREKEFMLDDIVSSENERRLFDYIYGRNGNQGNFLINTRPTNDLITDFEIL